MTFSRKEQWMIFGTINGLIAMTILLFPFYWEFATYLPISRCLMLEVLHLYCPACGGTRAFGALVDFDILSSIRYNPVVVFGAVVFIIYEVAMIRGLIKGKERECFLKPWMVYVFLALWMGYWLVRNILLFYGIDIVGDILR